MRGWAERTVLEFGDERRLRYWLTELSTSEEVGEIIQSLLGQDSTDVELVLGWWREHKELEASRF